jgi:hypothetical protein
MTRTTFIAALLLTTSSFAWAQTPAEHNAHHPQGAAQAPAAGPSAAAQGQPGAGGMPMMMNMMRMMPMMEQMGRGMGGMATIDRVEGRIAFLRAELKITDAQATAWNAFAEALRANAKKLGEVRGAMTSQPGTAKALSDRLELQESWLVARLEGTRTIKSAFTSLNDALSDEQKKTANEILAPHMGMMPMMSGMQPGQMGPGMMGPGMMGGGQMPPAQMGPGQMQPGRSMPGQATPR